MKRQIAMVAALVATLFGGTAIAGVILPSGLAPGSQYQIAFLTAATTTGTSGSESYYNSFVTAEAAPLTALLPSGVTWSAITTTWDGTTLTQAYDNAPTQTGLPIYNTLGQQVLGSGGILLSSDDQPSNLLAPMDGDQYGDQMTRLSYPQGYIVWTGIYPYPIFGSEPLGPVFPADAGWGLFDTTSSSWAWVDASPVTVALPVYALSSPITVPVPEPSTFALLGIGAISLLAYAWRRRKRVAA